MALGGKAQGLCAQIGLRKLDHWYRAQQPQTGSSIVQRHPTLLKDMLSSSARPASLPPSLQVGPIAARVHRHVHLAVSEQGLILGPNSTSTRQALVLSWQTNPQLSRLSDEHEYTTPPLEIRGIVGIVRLWAGSFSCSFVSCCFSAPSLPSRTSSCSSPSQREPTTPLQALH
jgi:hypothetical protein